MEKDKFLFVVSGAAGTGKDSVVKALREAHPEIEKTVSATTRSPRPGEQEGVDYYYRTQEQFRQLIDTDQVVEYNFYNGNYYGTLREEVDKRLEAGKLVVLVIDVHLSPIPLSEPTRRTPISYAVFCLKKKKKRPATRRTNQTTRQ